MFSLATHAKACDTFTESIRRKYLSLIYNVSGNAVSIIDGPLGVGLGQWQ
ncbi:hypothetical protein BSU04_25430 [Caballeronia sordidicola]|uniref:Uncharacterized protein n=1 Tax=Caballeronia sordidicola TaxID=196367 RepID=A0A226WWS6_CABSO|nr:hypothetical protein BSU04_25430 [Caballeronia sordidicola]